MGIDQMGIDQNGKTPREPVNERVCRSRVILFHAYHYQSKLRGRGGGGGGGGGLPLIGQTKRLLAKCMCACYML